VELLSPGTFAPESENDVELSLPNTDLNFENYGGLGLGLGLVLRISRPRLRLLNGYRLTGNR